VVTREMSDAGCFAGWIRARLKDAPEVFGIGLTRESALRDLHLAHSDALDRAAEAAEHPLARFMRQAVALVGIVTRAGWQIDGSPAVSPGADGGGEVVLTLRMPPR
jgi:hypothetical protein